VDIVGATEQIQIPLADLFPMAGDDLLVFEEIGRLAEVPDEVVETLQKFVGARLHVRLHLQQQGFVLLAQAVVGLEAGVLLFHHCSHRSWETGDVDTQTIDAKASFSGCPGGQPQGVAPPQHSCSKP